MKIQLYTDDGYREFDLECVKDELDIVELIEILHDRKVLSSEDINRILPTDFEVVESNGQ